MNRDKWVTDESPRGQISQPRVPHCLARTKLKVTNKKNPKTVSEPTLEGDHVRRQKRQSTAEPWRGEVAPSPDLMRGWCRVQTVGGRELTRLIYVNISIIFPGVAPPPSLIQSSDQSKWDDPDSLATSKCCWVVSAHISKWDAMRAMLRSGLPIHNPPGEAGNVSWNILNETDLDWFTVYAVRKWHTLLSINYPAHKHFTFNRESPDNPTLTKQSDSGTWHNMNLKAVWFTSVTSNPTVGLGIRLSLWYKRCLICLC